uniref:Histone H2A C-terminal domain-containing protein n=1 Tax=Setaria viridis TaxID=4556 RepID=A0A4U6U2H0_SETVI|nr:hypothetical protein SEVIR_6G136500v2 [Setaria viridis]
MGHPCRGPSRGRVAYIEAVQVQMRNLRSAPVHTITKSPFQLAIRGDEELNMLIKGTIAGGGVIPHIHKSLINKTAKE